MHIIKSHIPKEYIESGLIPTANPIDSKLRNNISIIIKKDNNASKITL